MKHIILINILLTLLFTSAHAAPISVGNINNINVANLFIGSSNDAACTTDCDFLNAAGTSLNDTALAPIVTSQVSNYVFSSMAGNNASFDLGFDGFNLYNRDGNDLVIFIVGNSTSFGLDVFDKAGSMISTGNYSVTTANTVFDNSGNWLCIGGSDASCTGGFPLSAVFIDFGNSFAGDVALGHLNLSLNNAAFSLAGGFHVTPIPLPLPIILFSSGLALLAFAGRKKKT